MRAALVRVTSAILGAGVCYLLWLAAFLLVARLDSPAGKAVLWVLAPIVTATGFAGGIAILGQVARTGTTGFFRILVWPLVGCAIGAGAVFWIGPMLIVFGMFAAGTAGVALRELLLMLRQVER